MREITLEELLEAGCHFGHQVTRHNPKSRDFVYEARDNIHIIDLAKTKEGLDEAAAYIKDLAAKGGTLVVVGTKRQAQPIIEEEIKRAFSQFSGKQEEAGLYYVLNRWIGGLLTNLSEVSKNFKKLNDIEDRLRDDEEKAKYTKKEIGLWEKERQKLQGLYGGICTMQKVPDALFIIDTHFEELAVREAHRMGVGTVGIVDTNADPTFIDYPIPANDDAAGSIKLITSYIIDAWIEGKNSAEQNKKEVEEPKTEKEVKEKQKKEVKVKEKKVSTKSKVKSEKAKVQVKSQK